MTGFKAVREQTISRKVFQIERDDRVGPTSESSGQHVTVIGVGQVQTRAKWFPTRDAGVLERVIHHVQTAPNSGPVYVRMDPDYSVRNFFEDAI